MTCGRRYSGRRRPDSQGLAGSCTRSSRSCIRRALALPERRPTSAVSAFGPSCPRLSARGELSGPLAERPVRAACFLPRHRMARPAPAWRPTGHSRGRRASHSGSCGRSAHMPRRGGGARPAVCGRADASAAQNSDLGRLCATFDQILQLDKPRSGNQNLLQLSLIYSVPTHGSYAEIEQDVRRHNTKFHVLRKRQLIRI